MKTLNMHSVIVLIILVFHGTSSVFGQTQSQVFVLPLEREVHIYHTRNMAPGESFHVYRQASPTADFERISDEPISMAPRIDEIASVLGESLDAVLNFFEVHSEAQLWMAIQNRPVESNIASILFPEAARLQGRLFIDSFPPTGNRATYRLDFFDVTGAPTGQQLSQTAEIIPTELNTPVITRAENTGQQVTLHWEFPMAPRGQTDFVIQFHIFRKNLQTGSFERVTDDIVIRNNATNQHRKTFPSPVINTTETYVVAAVDFSRRQGPMSNEFVYELIDNLPPAVVQGVQANQTDDTSVGISWMPGSETNLAGYKVYRGTDMSRAFEAIHEGLISTETPFFLDTNATGGQTYFYYVTAVDQTGNESEQGSLAMASIPDLLPPSAPSNFRGEFNLETTLVDLAWDMEEYSDNFNTFIILRKRLDSRHDLTYSRITFDRVTETSISDNGIADQGFIEGSKYQYVLYSASHAYNFSDTLSITVEIPIITPPDPPSHLTAISDNGHRINLSWNPSMSRNLAGYILYRKQPGEESFRQWAEIALNTRLFRDEKDLMHGEEYIYSMTAIDIAGNESIFSDPDTLFFRSSTPPSSVRNLQAAVQENGVELRWERVGSENLAGYKVFRANIPTGRYEPIHDDILQETHFFDTQGTSSSWYRVRAIDTSGNQSRPGNPVNPVIIQ